MWRSRRSVDPLLITRSCLSYAKFSSHQHLLISIFFPQTNGNSALCWGQRSDRSEKNPKDTLNSPNSQNDHSMIVKQFICFYVSVFPCFEVFGSFVLCYFYLNIENKSQAQTQRERKRKKGERKNSVCARESGPNPTPLIAQHSANYLPDWPTLPQEPIGQVATVDSAFSKLVYKCFYQPLFGVKSVSKTIYFILFLHYCTTWIEYCCRSLLNYHVPRSFICYLPISHCLYIIWPHLASTSH